MYVYDFTPVKRKINSWIQHRYYSGAAIMIVKNDSVVFEDYYDGYTKNTVIYIASAGKWLAAATIASVVEQTSLSWEDPVKKWIPEFTDEKGNATLRQLLSHTSGFPDYQPKGNPIDNYQSLEESVKHIISLPSIHAPGLSFHYGGLAMQVAGRMAELATGKTFETLFQEHIAKPLEMINTHFTPVDSRIGHNPMIGGGAKSTLQDYMHFLNMIFHDGVYGRIQILSKASIIEMQANQIHKAQLKPDEYVEHVRSKSHHSIYGLGEWREELDASGNAVLISSPSWAGAYPWIDKTTNSYGFFITHVNEETARNAGFSSFYSSPVLPIMVREVFDPKALPDSVDMHQIPEPFNAFEQEIFKKLLQESKELNKQETKIQK